MIGAHHAESRSRDWLVIAGELIAFLLRRSETRPHNS
jgi:hypothetical protein